VYTEREMVLDALQISKAGAVELTQAATEASNPALRQTLLQMRNNCEQSQQQIGQFAQSKRYGGIFRYPAIIKKSSTHPGHRRLLFSWS
jgi:spore coat protein CotF